MVDESSLRMTVSTRWHKTWWFIIPIIIIALIISFYSIFALTSTGITGPVEIITLSDSKPSNLNQLTILSINMAHGRSNSFHQAFLSTDQIKTNLKKIATIIKREKADIIGLQEADSPSWWSGSFSHVEELGKLSSMMHSTTAHNIDGFGLHYGTAVISQLPMTSAKQITFERSFPTPSKGFIVATHQWQGMDLDIISVHLDFASVNVRKAQLERISQAVKANNRPVIIMGDFNTDSSDGLLKRFMTDLKLKTHEIENNEIITYPAFNARIDWVFVSEQFNIIAHDVLEDQVSDHQVVKVVITN